MNKINLFVVLTIAMGLVRTSVAVLPDNLTINAGDIDNDGQDEILVLTKRSLRSSC